MRNHLSEKRGCSTCKDNVTAWEDDLEIRIASFINFKEAVRAKST